MKRNLHEQQHISFPRDKYSSAPLPRDVIFVKRKVSGAGKTAWLFRKHTRKRQIPAAAGIGGVQRSVRLAMLGVLSAIRPPLRVIRVLRRCVGQGLPLWATAGCLLRLRACGAGLFFVVLQAHRAWSCRVLRYFIAAGAAIKLAASAFRSAIAASRRRAGGCDPAGAGALPSRSGRSRLRSRRRHAGR